MPSRRSLLFGAGLGAATLCLGHAGLRQAFILEDRPPWVIEHAVDSLWLEGAGTYGHPPRPPLNQRQHTTDILIIGSGFTGLSTKWHLLQKRPQARTTLINAARCGFGSSGRDGGWCMGANYLAFFSTPQLARAAHDFMSAGVDIVRGLEQEEGIACDFTPAHRLRASCAVNSAVASPIGASRELDPVIRSILAPIRSSRAGDSVKWPD